MAEQDVSPFGGMTVNERLFHAGIIDKWDAAVRRRDREALVNLLKQVDLTDPEFTIDTLLASPGKYGV